MITKKQIFIPVLALSAVLLGSLAAQFTDQITSLTFASNPSCNSTTFFSNVGIANNGVMNSECSNSFGVMSGGNSSGDYFWCSGYLDFYQGASVFTCGDQSTGHTPGILSGYAYSFSNYVNAERNSNSLKFTIIDGPGIPSQTASVYQTQTTQINESFITELGSILGGGGGGYNPPDNTTPTHTTTWTIVTTGTITSGDNGMTGLTSTTVIINTGGTTGVTNTTGVYGTGNTPLPCLYYAINNLPVPSVCHAIVITNPGNPNNTDLCLLLGICGFTGTVHTGTITTGTVACNQGTYGYGYGYNPSYGYGFGFGYYSTGAGDGGYIYLISPMMLVSKTIYEEFKDLPLVKKLARGFSLQYMFDIKTYQSMRSEIYNSIQKVIKNISNGKNQQYLDVAKQAIFDYSRMILNKSSETKKDKMCELLSIEKRVLSSDIKKFTTRYNTVKLSIKSAIRSLELRMKSNKITVNSIKTYTDANEGLGLIDSRNTMSTILDTMITNVIKANCSESGVPRR